jgi:hypothetical protein
MMGTFSPNLSVVLLLHFELLKPASSIVKYAVLEFELCKQSYERAALQVVVLYRSDMSIGLTGWEPRRQEVVTDQTACFITS